MKKRCLTFIAMSSALTLAWNGLVTAQETAVAAPTSVDTKLPSGKEILAKHVAAIGGAEKIKAAKSTHITGEFKMPAVDLTAPLKIVFAQPHQGLFEIEIPGMGSVRKGTNGIVAWEISDISGPRILEDVERDQFLREVDTLADLHPEKYFKSIDCRGTEDVAGKSCYVVDFTSKNEDESVETRYFDAETFLLVKKKQVQSTNMGDISVESLVSDYREVNGMQVAHRNEISMMEQQQLITIDSVEFDQTLADDQFDFPEEIKELLEAANDATTAEAAGTK